MSDRICSHRDLTVYQKSFSAGRRIFELSKRFPREEMYSMTDQVRRSSRSVSANIAEAWRKRRYEKHFCSTLNIAEAEAAETQVWIDYAAAHGYLNQKTSEDANDFYDEILRMIVKMIHGSSNWCDLKSKGGGEPGSRGVGESASDYYIESEYPVIDQEALLSPSHSLPDSPSPHLPDSQTPPLPDSPSKTAEAEDA
jgi:four helix bundle protein